MDRFGGFLLSREPTGVEQQWLDAAKPPWPVRFVFAFALAVIVGLSLYLMFDLVKWMLDDESRDLPILRIGALMFCSFAVRFARDEVFMHYGRRALRAPQDDQ